MDPNKEPNRAADPNLDSLPEGERKETEEILDEIAKDQADAKPADGEPEKPEKPDKTEGEKPEEKLDEKPDKGKKDETPARREAKLMPSWIHERAKADWAKREKELVAAIDAAKKGGTLKEGENGEHAQKSEEEIQQFAEQNGVTVEFVKGLMKLSGTNTLPKELERKLEEIDQIKNERDAEAEEAAFEADFAKDVMPLIKAEYGDNIPAKVLEDLKEDFKLAAYDEKYAKIPYVMLYKGHDDFRGRTVAPKKGGERSGGAPASPSNEGDKPDLSKPMSEEDAMKLSDEEFDTYSQNMEKLERDGKL